MCSILQWFTDVAFLMTFQMFQNVVHSVTILIWVVFLTKTDIVEWLIWIWLVDNGLIGLFSLNLKLADSFDDNSEICEIKLNLISRFFRAVESFSEFEMSVESINICFNK